MCMHVYTHTKLIHCMYILQGNSAHVTFSSDIDEALSVYANIDKCKFGIVLRNLLSNAFKFTPEGGKVTLKAYPILVKEDGTVADITVSPITHRFHSVESLRSLGLTSPRSSNGASSHTTPRGGWSGQSLHTSRLSVMTSSPKNESPLMSEQLFYTTTTININGPTSPTAQTSSEAVTPQLSPIKEGHIDDHDSTDKSNKSDRDSILSEISPSVAKQSEVCYTVDNSIGGETSNNSKKQISGIDQNYAFFCLHSDSVDSRAPDSDIVDSKTSVKDASSRLSPVLSPLLQHSSESPEQPVSHTVAPVNKPCNLSRLLAKKDNTANNMHTSQKNSINNNMSISKHNSKNSLVSYSASKKLNLTLAPLPKTKEMLRIIVSDSGHGISKVPDL